MKTKEKLARALVEVGAPDWMIENARKGDYDDFESHSPTPILDLVIAASRLGLDQIANRAREGEFDGTREEAQEWVRKEGFA